MYQLKNYLEKRKSGLVICLRGDEFVSDDEDGSNMDTERKKEQENLKRTIDNWSDNVFSDISSDNDNGYNADDFLTDDDEF